MPTVIPVKFRYAARDLWFDPKDTGAVEADHVICATERGTEIGLVSADAREVTQEEFRAMCGDAVLKPILRIATEEDLDRADHLAQLGDDALPVFRQMVGKTDLDMKPVGVEYLFGGEKVVCYFSAEERVDFRQLVRDLARELHERIDMRQIGVREEAAIVGGYAHCGQELCCARFGHQFEPVSIRMAKEQDLPLNSTKISGACGRLMCCLRYEFEAYRDFKSRAPKRNAIIDTPLGKGKIIEYDTPKEQITLRLENGKQVRVALADMETSEAAVRKSEELNCPCRPDTAPRAALERLASPEVQLALAELDREMGIVPEGGIDGSDLFVEPSRPRRRRRGERTEAAAQGKGEDAKGKGSKDAKEGKEGASSSTRSRRRRKKRADAPANQVQAQGASTQQRAESGQGEAKTPRRRRHHTSDASAKQSGEEQKREGKPRRRPGDRGGDKAAQPQKAAQSQKGAQSQKQGQQRPNPAAAEAGEGAAPKRRRRHRGGRGRGKGKGGAEGTSQAQGGPKPTE